MDWKGVIPKELSIGNVWDKLFTTQEELLNLEQIDCIFLDAA